MVFSTGDTLRSGDQCRLTAAAASSQTKCLYVWNLHGLSVSVLPPDTVPISVTASAVCVCVL